MTIDWLSTIVDSLAFSRISSFYIHIVKLWVLSPLPPHSDDFEIFFFHVEILLPFYCLPLDIRLYLPIDGNRSFSVWANTHKAAMSLHLLAFGWIYVFISLQGK